MGMKVKAVVVLDVQDVETWEDAYATVFDLVGGRPAVNYAHGGYQSARIRKVISVEADQESE